MRTHYTRNVKKFSEEEPMALFQEFVILRSNFFSFLNFCEDISFSPSIYWARWLNCNISDLSFRFILFPFFSFHCSFRSRMSITLLHLYGSVSFNRKEIANRSENIHEIEAGKEEKRNTRTHTKRNINQTSHLEGKKCSSKI